MSLCLDVAVAVSVVVLDDLQVQKMMSGWTPPPPPHAPYMKISSAWLYFTNNKYKDIMRARRHWGLGGYFFKNESFLTVYFNNF